MPQAIESIPTRQRAEVLDDSSDRLGAGDSFESRTSKVAGFNAVSIFGVSDQPFRVRVFEGCSATGRFAMTHEFLSAAAAGVQVVCDHVLPCGPFLRTVLDNLGAPQGFLSVCSLGIPEP